MIIESTERTLDGGCHNRAPRGQVEKWLAHIHALAVDIGPRGSTTEGERLGAAYCVDVFRHLGLAPRVEGFTSARSIFQPHLFAACALLLAFALYPLAGRAGAAVAALISAVALAADLLELSFIDNPLRRIVAKGPSQNVVAIVPPAGKHLRDLVLIGHIDTQRTPLVFSTPRWLAIYKAFTTVAFVLFAVQVLLFVLGIVTQWAWIWPAASPSALGAALLMALCIQADRTPFTAGANDNASAVGLVLTLGEALVAKPLEHTRVWLTCTGCEEVQHYGAIDFFRRHRNELVRPAVVAFEMLGCAGPSWLTKEGIVVPFHASPVLVRLAETLVTQHPALAAYPGQINGGNTEMADALRLGIPAITIVGQTRTGDLPYWHQVGDTFDKMDPEVMGRTYAFTQAFMEALDRGAADSPEK
ncbi:MAG TPA: M28 family peptidase [Anaerolineae bacterium]